MTSSRATGRPWVPKNSATVTPWLALDLFGQFDDFALDLILGWSDAEFAVGGSDNGGIDDGVGEICGEHRLVDGGYVFAAANLIA